MFFALHQVNSLSSDVHHQLFIPYKMYMYLYIRGGTLLFIIDFYWYFKHPVAVVWNQHSKIVMIHKNCSYHSLVTFLASQTKLIMFFHSVQGNCILRFSQVDRTYFSCRATVILLIRVKTAWIKKLSENKIVYPHMYYTLFFQVFPVRVVQGFIYIHVYLHLRLR